MKNARLFFALACAALISSCTSCPLGGKLQAKGSIEHVVLLWLKKPGNAADRAQIIAKVKSFQSNIPGIQHLSVGTALPSERPVVDDSFDVGIVMGFANAADLASYEKNPVHTAAVNDTLKPLAKKLLVYDVVRQ